MTAQPAAQPAAQPQAQPVARPGPIDPGVDAIVADAWIAHHERLFAAVVRCTRDPDVADDIVAETFEAFLREARLGRIADNHAAWLHRVARNRVVDWSRRRARWSGHGVEREATGDDPAAEVLCRERADALRLALGHLPEAGRRAVVLEGQGYRPAEIAPMLGRTNQATRTLLCRSRRRMQQELASAVA